MGEELKINGEQFSKAVTACKGFVRKLPRGGRMDFLEYLEISVTKGSSMANMYACNGYMLIRQNLPLMKEAGDSFYVFLKVPRLKPGKRSIVTVQAAENHGSLVSFDDVTFTCKMMEESENSIHQLENQVKRETTAFRTAFNAGYIAEAATAVRSGSDRAMILEISGKPLDPIHFSGACTDAYVLPTRLFGAEAIECVPVEKNTERGVSA